MNAPNSVATGKKSKKDTFLIFIAVIAVAVILLSAFWINLQIRPASTTVVEPIPSVTGYYLPYEVNISKIFVVSANASYGYYPYPTVTSPPNGSTLAKKEEPCVIINVTIRDDYSTQYPAPNPAPVQYNPTFAYVFLTGQIFNGENQINATDITPPVGFANGGAYAPLNSGESATLTIYLATNNTNITSFQIVTRYIGGLALP